MVRHFVVVSDLHCGSTVGLCPTNLVSCVDQTPIVQNDWQKWLWERWLDFWRWIDAEIESDADVSLVLNGDLIEGVHHRSVQCWPETADHISAAIETLRPVVQRATRTFVVVGTESHTKSSEHGIAAAIGAEKMPDGSRASDILHVEAGDVLLTWAHHCQATSRPWLRSGELSRLMSTARQNAIDAGLKPSDFVGAAHRHQMDYWTDGGRQHCVIGPAWQLLTRYGYKVVPHAKPTIGGYIVTVDNDRIERVRLKPYGVPEPRRYKID